ncbi:uncharacterized protein BXZ73DRAFT_83352, partial [Epithele typhae]|uniref:uncharacterized protein n=1 Tax=Epithele typhae TaxID=378194 RepID=UPI002008185F
MGILYWILGSCACGHAVGGGHGQHRLGKGQEAYWDNDRRRGLEPRRRDANRRAEDVHWDVLGALRVSGRWSDGGMGKSEGGRRWRRRRREAPTRTAVGPPVLSVGRGRWARRDRGHAPPRLLSGRGVRTRCGRTGGAARRRTGHGAYRETRAPGYESGGPGRPLRRPGRVEGVGEEVGRRDGEVEGGEEVEEDGGQLARADGHTAARFERGARATGEEGRGTRPTTSCTRSGRAGVLWEEGRGSAHEGRGWGLTSRRQAPGYESKGPGRPLGRPGRVEGVGEEVRRRDGEVGGRETVEEEEERGARADGRRAACFERGAREMGEEGRGTRPAASCKRPGRADALREDGLGSAQEDGARAYQETTGAAVLNHGAGIRIEGPRTSIGTTQGIFWEALGMLRLLERRLDERMGKVPSSQSSSTMSLNHDIIHAVCTHLPPSSVVKVAQTSKTMYEVAMRPALATVHLQEWYNKNKTDALAWVQWLVSIHPYLPYPPCHYIKSLITPENPDLIPHSVLQNLFSSSPGLSELVVLNSGENLHIIHISFISKLTTLSLTSPTLPSVATLTPLLSELPRLSSLSVSLQDGTIPSDITAEDWGFFIPSSSPSPKSPNSLPYPCQDIGA